MIVGEKKKSALAHWVFVLSLVLLAILVLVGPAANLEIISPLRAFLITSSVSVIGGGITIIAAIIAFIYVWRKKLLIGKTKAFIALVIGFAMLSPVGLMFQKGAGLPPIHDITTDVQNPPAFIVLKEGRDEDLNSLDYAGVKIAQQQTEAYADIIPIISRLAPEKSFDISLEIAKELGWEIASADSGAGRIEATDRTFWFNFADDVVIVVSSDPSNNDLGSIINIRSVSQVGVSDIGANAERIRTFTKMFDQKS